MKLPFLSSFFKKNEKTLEIPESLLVKKLKSVSKKNNLLIFQNITIYHHNENLQIPLLLLDENRGIFLFEYKDWSYDDLKNAKIQKASNQNTSKDTLAYEKSHELIKKRFNELTHNDGVPICNYLLMENLNFDQYKHLDQSFQELLPEDKVMFSDSSQENIIAKLLEANRITYNLPSTSRIMSILLTQYSVLDDNEKSFLASNEQIKFVDSELDNLSILSATHGSGRTTTLLLKAISEKLKNPQHKIVIVKPNKFSCDMLKKKFLEMIEYAIVEIDPASVIIITPDEFIGNPPKNIYLLMCDDTWAYSQDFITDIKNIKHKEHLILVENSDAQTHTNTLTKSFRNNNRTVSFYDTNQHAKALQIVSSLLQNNLVSDILVVGNNLGRVKLKDDLIDFIDHEALLLDGTKSLIDQNLESLVLSSYDDIYPKEVKYVILMNICFADIEKLKYSYNLATESIFVLYDTESDNLNAIRNNFESN